MSEVEKQAASEKKKRDRKVREELAATKAACELLDSERKANEEDEHMRAGCAARVAKFASDRNIVLDSPADWTVTKIISEFKTAGPNSDSYPENIFLSSKTYVEAMKNKYSQPTLAFQPKPESMVVSRRKPGDSTTHGCTVVIGKFVWRDILMDICETMSRAHDFLTREPVEGHPCVSDKWSVHDKVLYTAVMYKHRGSLMRGTFEEQLAVNVPPYRVKVAKDLAVCSSEWFLEVDPQRRPERARQLLRMINGGQSEPMRASRSKGVQAIANFENILEGHSTQIVDLETEVGALEAQVALQKEDLRSLAKRLKKLEDAGSSKA